MWPIHTQNKQSITRKENDRTKSLMNIVTKVLDKILTNQQYTGRIIERIINCGQVELISVM